MKYKLGLASISFRENSPEQILKEMKNTPLTHIEWGSDVHVPPQKAKEILKLQKKYGILCSSYGTYFRVGISNIDEIYDYIDAAKTLGTNIMRLWCGNKNSEDYTDAEKALLFDQCRKLSQIAEKEGVILCMECHQNTYTNKKESAYELMRAVNSDNFKMYWQPNEYVTICENINYAKLISPYIQNIHIFNWKYGNQFSLSGAVDEWKKYIGCFEKADALLLEFMPDGNLSSLKTEALALKEIVL